MSEAILVEFDVPVETLQEINAATATALVEQPSAPSVPMTPTAMLSHAITCGADMVVVEKLMTLQERWEANEARKAFDEAMAEARAEIKPVSKNRRVVYENKGGGTTDYRHESLSDIAEQIDPILSRHGLSYRYRATSNPNEPIRVTCIVAHRRGHFEETTLSAGADNSGGKNSIQAIGSAITYLQRYTLKAALGLAAAHDDDGRSASETADSVTLITSEQIAELEALAGDQIAEFCRYAKIARIADIHADKFERAKSVLLTKKRVGGAQ